MVPNVVYVGMGKAGSTLLHKLFLKHPKICVSDANKEINFFANQVNWAKGKQWYESRFDNYQGEPWVVDISPGYHNKQVAVQRIREMLGEHTKIIFTFRRFTEFAFSRYLHRLRGKRLQGGFFELLEQRNMFYKPLDAIVGNYIDTFGQENVLLMHYEKEFDRKFPTFERCIYQFLGLPEKESYCATEDGEVNSGYYPRFVFSGNTPYEEEVDGVSYKVPENRLVFCSGRPYRNVFWSGNVQAKVDNALELQRGWTTVLTEKDYTHVQKNYTEPLAERLEKRLGISFEHWFVSKPRRLEYKPAPLPDAYILDPDLKASRLEGNQTQTPWS